MWTSRSAWRICTGTLRRSIIPAGLNTSRVICLRWRNTIAGHRPNAQVPGSAAELPAGFLNRSGNSVKAQFRNVSFRERALRAESRARPRITSRSRGCRTLFITRFITGRDAPAHLIKEVEEECELNSAVLARGSFRTQNYDCSLSVRMNGKFADIKCRCV